MAGYTGMLDVLRPRGYDGLMAKLVQTESPNGGKYLDKVEGWLDDSDPFFAAIDEIVDGRSEHVPRVLRIPCLRGFASISLNLPQPPPDASPRLRK